MRRKVLVVAILIVAMLLQCVMPFTAVNAGTSVVITLNINLYKAVKSQLEEQNIAADYRDANGIIIISQDELEKVTSLNLENSEIDDLTGLDAFTNVTSINLHANKLTENSNLQVLDSLSLTDLDLSSNQLRSIKSITSYSDITNADITNQRITERQIVEVDDSEDAEEREMTVTVSLPDILLEDGNRIKPEWLVNNLGEPSRTIVSYTDPVTGVTTTPEIDFESSFATGSSDMVLKVARGTAGSYEALRGLIKFEIKVNDSTSKLADTHMVFYYAVVNSEETGMAFDDENMYKAVRNQLTKGQTQNDELYETTNVRNIYSRTYDEALIMVIDDNDIVNNVPSLLLNDKKIRDLRGLEQFVGLESNLDISYNYITTIQRVIELEEMKTQKEQEIREKYSKILELLKTNVTAYDAEIAKAKDAQKAYEKSKSEYDAATDAAVKAAKATEMTTHANEKATAQDAADRYLILVNKYVNKLYTIYEKEYRLVTLLSKEVNYLSYEDLLKANLETVKGYATTTMDRISTIEKADALTSFENWAISTLMKEWADDNGLEFKTTKTVFEANPAGGDPIEKTVPIEYPISEFFDLVKSDGTLEISDFEELVYIFKAIDALSQVDNYSMIKRVFEESPTPTIGSDFVKDAIDDVKKLYEQKGYDTSFYDMIVYNASIDGAYLSNGTTGTTKSGYEINNTTGLYPVHLGLAEDQYSGTVADDRKAEYRLAMGHRLGTLSDDDITTYITLPRVQKLDMADNKTRSLEGIDSLSELKSLNAWKNLVNDISNVDWSKFTQMKVLNLGYNQISDVSPLEEIHTLEALDVSYNLLSGRFTFNLINMKKLKVANFAHNQYEDIQYANDQFILKAMGYDADGDGVAEGYTVPEYLEAAGITLSFKYQTIEMSATIVNTGEEFIEFELPLIFRQLEKLDNEKTSFGIDSIGGLVEPEGTTVKLRVPAVGTTGQTLVTVQGRNGYHDSEADEEYTGIGYGTTCKIYYTVVEEPTVNPPVDPENPPVDPENPSEPTEIELGYPVIDGYVVVNIPETSTVEFASRLVDLAKYDVTISQNKSSDKIGTGSVVTVIDKENPELVYILEIVVKGDINGDGEVDGLDSGIIRNIIADKEEKVGAYEKAADVNNDGDIDSLDSMLILKYRADRISSFED